MNTVWRLLKLPWLATVKPRGWWLSPLLIWLVWTMILGDNAGSLHHASWQRWGLVALLLGVFTLWMCAVSNTFNLRRDAHVLQLPHASREADWCLLAYLVLSVVLPSLIIGGIFGHTLALATLLLLAASTSLAGRLLPARITLLMIIPFALGYILFMTGHLRIPTPGEPGFLAWAVPLALAFSVLAVARWGALRKVMNLGDSTFASLGVFNDRRIRMGRLTGTSSSSHYQGGILHDPGTPRAKLLRNVGPEFPIRSLRAALHARIRPWGLIDKGRHGLSAQQVIAVVVLAIALLVFLIARYFGRNVLLQFTPMGLMAAGIVMAGYAKMFWRHLDASSQDHGSGRALLALLPNLGSLVQVRRRALLAWLTPDIHWTIGIGLIAAVVCVLLRVPPMCYLYLALMAAGGVATCAALMANTLGGTPFRPWATYVFYPVGVVLASLTAFWGVQGADSKPVSLHTPLLPTAVCIALWLAWLAAMAILARRGWRALQRRPHPFFTNAS